MNASRNNLPFEVAEAVKNRSRLTEAMAAVKRQLLTTKAGDKSKKRSQILHAWILTGIFLFGILLPPGYKIFAPLLFIIPSIIDVVNKARMAGETSRLPLRDQTYTPPMPSRIPSLDPYTAMPKNPKDPRRYKPIG